MSKPSIITALDIGSGSIKILTVFKKPGEPNFKVLSQSQEFSLGIRKGVVIDVRKVSGIISFLVKKIEQDCGQKIDSVYASIGGGHMSCTSSRGLVSVSRADQKISEEDVERVLQAARVISLSPNKEIIEVFPKEFIVDGEGGIREPVGMQGVRLEAETLVLCGFSPYLKNSTQTVLNAGLQLNDLVPNSLASSRAILTPKEKELGVCLLDIGAGTTSLAVFEEGNLIHTAVFPVGSANISNDIAICLRTDIDTAERIKLEFGSCKTSSFREKKTYKSRIRKSSVKEEKRIKIDPSPLAKGDKVEGEEQLVFSKKMLTEIIEARLSEIFEMSNKELKEISRQKMLPAGIVLTGGGAKLSGIRNLAKKEFKLTCRIGSPFALTGGAGGKFRPSFQEDPSLSTLYGLILEGADLEDERRNPSTKGIWTKLKRVLRTFKP